MARTDICADCAVRDRALCSSLDERDHRALRSLGQIRNVAAGQTIAWAGDEAAICGHVVSGILKLVAATPAGREQIVGLLYPADFFGTPYAGQTDFDIVALTDTQLCIFPRAAFERVLDDHQAMERLLLRRTLETLNDARSRMLDLGRKTATEKVAGFLIDMAQRTGNGGRCAGLEDGPATFELPLTRGQIADVLGMTIETVSRQITRLKTSGVIALPGGRGITIRNADALTALSEAA